MPTRPLKPIDLNDAAMNRIHDSESKGIRHHNIERRPSANRCIARFAISDPLITPHRSCAPWRQWHQLGTKREVK
jgi:hypothetical protein